MFFFTQTIAEINEIYCYFHYYFRLLVDYLFRFCCTRKYTQNFYQTQLNWFILVILFKNTTIMHVTIKDIAVKLGISTSTVSRALKDHPDISLETRRKVQSLAKQMGYKPNTIALSLRSSRSYTIGVIIPQIVHHFFSSVISGIENVASRANYNVMIYQSNESYERELMNIQSMMSSRVDGVIMSITKETLDSEHMEEIVSNNIPIVFFDRVCNDFQADRVIIDDFKAAYMAVEHLIKMGCRKILHYSGAKNLQIGKLRKLGYLNALLKNNITPKDEWVIQADTFEQSVVETQRLISQQNLPNGIFAINDSAAIAAMMTLKKQGFRVPEDVAIAGFTNGLISQVTDPQLTTVEQNGFMMGQKAAEIVLGRITGKITGNFITEVIPTELLIRGSSLKYANE